MAHDARDLLPALGCPALVAHGTHDAMTPPVDAHLLAGGIAGARLHLHPGGRHGFLEEFADDLDPVLHTFWAGADRP